MGKNAGSILCQLFSSTQLYFRDARMFEELLVQALTK